MNIYRAYGAFFRDIIEVCDATNFLAKQKPQERIQYVRLEEQPFILTERIAYSEQIVTAHKLSQYVKRFSKVKLTDKSATWLNVLIQQDIREKEGRYDEIDGN